MELEGTFDPTPSSVLSLDTNGQDSQGRIHETMSTVTTFDLESRQSSHQVLRTGLAAQGDPQAALASADVTITTFDLESQQSSMRTPRSPAALGTPLPRLPPQTVVGTAGPEWL
jgi:hypothetical protein